MQPVQLRGLIARLLDFKYIFLYLHQVHAIIVIIMCFEICKTSLSGIRKGHFPLNHDCILQVYYRESRFNAYEFFSCRCQDSGILTSVISQLSCVSKVKVIPVDKFNS